MYETPAAPNLSEAKLDPKRDLSSEIIAMVEREPGDMVKCTRIGEVNYRCNWWSARVISASPQLQWQGGNYATHIVRKSQFLQAVSTPEGLVLRDIGIVGRTG